VRVVYKASGIFLVYEIPSWRKNVHGADTRLLKRCTQTPYPDMRQVDSNHWIKKNGRALPYSVSRQLAGEAVCSFCGQPGFTTTRPFFT
jgi:hypothetical protein